MSTQFYRIVAFIFPVALLLSGCKTFDQGTDQEIAVQTFPSGANVTLDGEDIGTTPVTLDLPRKITHRVVISKEGYKTVDATIAPVQNEAGKGMVKFGLMDAAGMYYDLDPNPVEIQLVPDMLPPTRGPDAYTEMTAIIADVDQKRMNGEITPVEHKYMVEKVVEFYTQ